MAGERGEVGRAGQAVAGKPVDARDGGAQRQALTLASDEQALSVPQRLARYRAEKYNVIVPFEVTSDRLDPYHAFRVAVTKVDPDPAAGDVYKVGAQMVKGTWINSLALARPSLQRMGLAAGVVWDPDRSGRIDDGRDPNYICWKAVGLFRGPDGQWRTIQGTKEIDLRVTEDEIRDEQWTKMQRPGFKLPDKYSYMKGKPEEEVLDFLVSRELLQWRKHKLARAETGAMLRALRSMGIKSSFTADQLSRPFVFVRVDRAPDYSRPEIAQTAVRAMAADAADLYGGPPVVNGTPVPLQTAREAQQEAAQGEKPTLPQEDDPSPSSSEAPPPEDPPPEHQTAAQPSPPKEEPPQQQAAPDKDAAKLVKGELAALAAANSHEELTTWWTERWPVVKSVEGAQQCKDLFWKRIKEFANKQEGTRATHRVAGGARPETPEEEKASEPPGNGKSQSTRRRPGPKKKAQTLIKEAMRFTEPAALEGWREENREAIDSCDDPQRARDLIQRTFEKLLVKHETGEDLPF